MADVKTGSGGQIGEVVSLPGPESGDFKSRWRQIPRLTIDALRVAWQASPYQLIATMLLQVGGGVAITLQLLAAQWALSKIMVIGDADTSGSDVILPFALLIAAMVLMGALTALAEQRQRLLGELVAQHAYAKIIGVSTRVELAAFENPEFHDQLERARNSAAVRSLALVGAVSGVTMNLFTSGGVAVGLLLIEPLLVPLVLIAAVPLMFATVLNSRRAYTFEWSMTPENRERSYLIELLTRKEAAKELRVFGSSSFLRARYEALAKERLRQLRAFLRSRLGVALAGSIATSVGMGIALAALAYLIAMNRISVTDALIAGAAMQRLSTSMFGMMSSLGQVVESGMFVDDYNSFLRILPPVENEDEMPEWMSNPTSAAPEGKFNGLSVEGVTFKYPETRAPVLHDVSLRIDPGEVVALVGENGSGKTTLVKLICQLYQPLTGKITWGGANGRPTADLEEVRSDTTVVFQDFLQYQLTVADNIALGRVGRHPTDEALHEAAVQAGAERFVSHLPEDYETRLGRQFADGQDLSVGQWQRLALARAFYRGGRFLVLDEPTASLDPKAEYALFQQMRELWQGRSVLLVSHRFSSVRSADRIYVLEHGRVTESGSHTELMAADGHYAELFSLQAAAYIDEPADPGQMDAVVARDG